MKIDGMTLQEWARAPYGAFGKAVRLSLDPDWGADITVTEEREFEVCVDYSYSGQGRAHFTVKAFDEKEAKTKALAQFDKQQPDMFDAEVDRANVSSCKQL